METQTKTTVKESFKLPKLAYSTDALEPYIDQKTMEIHYGKHHNGYVVNLNNAISGTEIENFDLESIFEKVSDYPKAIRNNGGGHYNHSLFWDIMSPEGGGEPAGELANAIKDSFGSFELFKKKFEDAALSIFGSGWAWLVVKDDLLKIGTTPNQDNPLMDISEFKGMPIFGLDIWEHAYYLKYQNRRIDYVSSFWNIVNWDEISRRYKATI